MVQRLSAAFKKLVRVLLRASTLSGPAVSHPQLYLAFHLPQCKALGAIRAQPEVFNRFMVCVLFCMEAEKSAAIKAHQRFGALRIGTLRDHESVAAAHTLDVNFSTHVARNRKFLDMSERRWRKSESINSRKC